MSVEWLKDRARGLVLGCALGDAVGLATEFMSAEEAQRTYQPILAARAAEDNCFAVLRPGDGVRDFHRSKWVPGDWTDDTDHLVLVLQCLLPEGTLVNSPRSPDDSALVGSDSNAGPDSSLDGKSNLAFRDPDATEFAKKLLDWQRMGFPELGDKGGCGMGRTTARVIEDPHFASDPVGAARRAWDATGRCVAPNGALMRSAATGLRGLDHCVRDAATFAHVTHADPRSTAACTAVAVFVASLLDGHFAGATFDTLAGNAIAAAEKALPADSGLWKPAPLLWACPQCTYENAADAKACDVCGGDPPAHGTGTINAGFGVSWNAQEAGSRSYGRDIAEQELRRAVLGPLPGEAAPRLDDPQTMGYVNTCLSAAFGMLRTAIARKESADSCDAVFRTIIHELVMEGGDADTNAAVAGALVGCLIGASELPSDWLEALPHRAWIEAYADQVARGVEARTVASAPGATADSEPFKRPRVADTFETH